MTISPERRKKTYNSIICANASIWGAMLDKLKSNDVRRLGDPGTPAFRVEKYPFYLLNRLASRYNAIITERLHGLDLDIPFWRVLMILGEEAPRSIGAIAEAAVINVSTMMRIIQRMTEAGLITCRPRPDDARVIEVFLTGPGNAKLAKARKLTAPVYATAISGLSQGDFLALTGLLDRVYRNLTLPKPQKQTQGRETRKRGPQNSSDQTKK
jgi:DNA-binding MarR family transcriptional regulator